LGASALMQGLADGYFVIPYTLGHHLASRTLEKVTTDHAAFGDAEAAARTRIDRLTQSRGRRTALEFHRELGRIMWDHCGMSRNAEGLSGALDAVRGLRQAYAEDLYVPGDARDFNASLEHAGRVEDFLELGELMIQDALHREESCGGHFREEHRTEEGEARRNDDDFCYVAAWERGGNGDETLHKEPLEFEEVKLTQRSYK